MRDKNPCETWIFESSHRPINKPQKNQTILVKNLSFYVMIIPVPNVRAYTSARYFILQCGRSFDCL